MSESRYEKNLELLKKVYRLAERGESGERDAARRMLDKLMKKYHIDEADLSDDAVRDFEFTYHSEYEKTILSQVFYKIAPKRVHGHYRRGKGSRTTLWITCTEAEGLQIGIEYDFYREIWKDEVGMFLRAFIHKHEIYDMSPGHATSDIDAETRRRLAKMINSLQDHELHPMLESNN